MEQFGVYQGENYVRVMIRCSDDTVIDLKMTPEDFTERLGIKL